MWLLHLWSCLGSEDAKTNWNVFLLEQPVYWPNDEHTAFSVYLYGNLSLSPAELSIHNNCNLERALPARCRFTDEESQPQPLPQLAPSWQRNAIIIIVLLSPQELFFKRTFALKSRLHILYYAYIEICYDYTILIQPPPLLFHFPGCKCYFPHELTPAGVSFCFCWQNWVRVTNWFDIKTPSPEIWEP